MTTLPSLRRDVAAEMSGVKCLSLSHGLYIIHSINSNAQCVLPKNVGSHDHKISLSLSL